LKGGACIKFATNKNKTERRQKAESKRLLFKILLGNFCPLSSKYDLAVYYNPVKNMDKSFAF